MAKIKDIKERPDEKWGIVFLITLIVVYYVYTSNDNYASHGTTKQSLAKTSIVKPSSEPEPNISVYMKLNDPLRLIYRFRLTGFYRFNFTCKTHKTTLVPLNTEKLYLLYLVFNERSGSKSFLPFINNKVNFYFPYNYFYADSDVELHYRFVEHMSEFFDPGALARHMKTYGSSFEVPKYVIVDCFVHK